MGDPTTYKTLLIEEYEAGFIVRPLVAGKFGGVEFDDSLVFDNLLEMMKWLLQEFRRPNFDIYFRRRRRSGKPKGSERKNHG